MKKINSWKVAKELSELFCPSGSFALLNPLGCEEMLFFPQKSSKRAILSHIKGRSWKAVINGRSVKTSVCVVVDPISSDSDGLTRVWAMGAKSESERSHIQRTLIERRITSFSYMASPVIAHFDDPSDPNDWKELLMSRIYDPTSDFKGSLLRHFASRRLFSPEIKYIVLSCFNEPMPWSLLQSLTLQAFPSFTDCFLPVFHLPVTHPLFSQPAHIKIITPNGQHVLPLNLHGFQAFRHWGILQ